jgi:ABC-type nitrate/sulfonate/bicarbonate transport system permease component
MRKARIRLFLRELGYLIRNALGSIFSYEFLTIFIPILMLWEALPRFDVVPRSLIPPLSVVAVTFYEMIVHEGFLVHVGHSMGKFFLAQIGRASCRERV